ncbi:hypothetical protein STA1M1_09620 [Sinisalibacter aestuarii]|uniref:Peptidoglycan binding-like domain-containing protein n=2 Tax=Sinisalibacter aestuarii TaxID=2949426 RepID=A0ABQ5LR59_9RHOB|nr:hypothetical protein STA1M1_09620 [Sinisalibacter aestuarii]
MRVINDINRAIQGQLENDTGQPNPNRSGNAPAVARQTVREVQALLTDMGYDPGPIDGMMGQRTRNAILAFERDYGLPVTGVPGPDLLADLRYAAAGSASQPEPTASQPAQPLSGQPSFDCGKATTPSERAICGSSDLAELDQAIARNFTSAYEGAGRDGRERLLNEQRAWLAQRDDCGGDAPCLASSMGVRAQNLAQIAAVIGGTPPVASTGVEGGATAAEATEVAGNRAVDQGETLLITYTGSGSGIRPESEEQQRQRDLLARTISSQVLGTELEPVFLDQQPLTPEQVHQIFETAGVPIPQVLQIQMDRERVKNATDVRFNADLSRSDINEFERQRIEAAMRDTARAAMIADAIDTPLPLTLICGIGTDAYDFERQMFPFDQDDIKYCFAGEPNNVGSLRGHKTQLPIQTDFHPEGYPVDPSTAEQVVDELRGSRFALAIPATVTGRIANDRNGRPKFVFQVTPTGPLEVRPGPDLTRVLHIFSSDQMRDVNDTPEARRLADFDRAWWLENTDEIDIIAARAVAEPAGAIDSGSLFDTFTGLTFAFRGAYSEALTTGDRNLADFVKTGSGRDLVQLSQALNVPVENMVEVSLPLVGGTTARFQTAVIVLPQPLSAYSVTDMLPDYAKQDDGWPFSNVEFKVTAENVASAPDGREVLLLAGHPDRLVVRRSSPKVAWQNAPEIASVSFSRAEVSDALRIELAWKSDLIWTGARLAGVDPAQVFVQQLANSRFAGSDSFARMEAAQQLTSAAATRNATGDPLWMKARIVLDPYDFEKQGWRVGSLSPALSADAPEADGALQVQLIAAGDDMQIFIPEDQDAARTFQQGNPGFPEFDALIAVRVSNVDSGIGTDLNRQMTVRYEPVEILLFDSGTGEIVFNEQAVRLRHVYEAKAEAPVASTESPDPGIAGDLVGSLAILGMRLGDDFETALASISDQIGAERRYFATTDARQSAAVDANVRPIMDWDSFHNGVLLEAPSRREMVAIYHEPPALAHQVTAMSRTMIFAPGSGPSWPQLRDNMLQTYPQILSETLPDGDLPATIALWLEPPIQPGQTVDANASACKRSFAASVATSGTMLDMDREARETDILKSFDNRATWVDEKGDPAIPAFASPLSMPWLFEGRGDCPDYEFMAVTLAYGDDGRILEFRQAVSNPASLAAIAADRQRAAENEPPEFELKL